MYKQTTRWNLGKHVKIYHGITALQHLIDPKQMASLKEPFDESKKFSSIATVRTRWKVVVWLYGMLLLSAKCSWQTGNLRTKDDLENHSKGQWYFLEHWLNIIRFHREIYQDFINLASKYYLEYSMGMHCTREVFGNEIFWCWSRWEFGKETFWLRTWKIWKSWTHQKFILEESTRKKCWRHKGVNFWYSQSPMEHQNCQEETTNSQNPLQCGNKTSRREDFSGELQGESGESRPTRTTDDAEARADFWSIQGDFIYRHHNEPRVQLSRTTHTSLYCTKNVSAMIGTSMWIEFCQIHGQDSRSSHYWTKTLPKEKRGQRCDSQGCLSDHDRDCLTNLRFADDVMLFATSKEQLRKMVHEFKKATEKVGLRIHPDKTKILSNQSTINSNTNRHIEVGEISIEILTRNESVKYLGQRISFHQQETLEIQSRIRAARATFHKYRQELTKKKYMLKHRLSATQQEHGHLSRLKENTKIEKEDIEPKEEKGIVDITEICSTDDERDDGQSTKSEDDVDSEVTFEEDSDKKMDTIEIEEEDWIEYIKRSTADALDKMEHAKIRCWNKTHRKMKWKLALRIATSPCERWLKKAAEWNTDLSSRYKTNRAIGRPRKRWEDDINDFLKTSTWRKGKWRPNRKKDSKAKDWRR